MKTYFALLAHSGPQTKYLPIIRRVEFSASNDDDARKIAAGACITNSATPEIVHSMGDAGTPEPDPRCSIGM